MNRLISAIYPKNNTRSDSYNEDVGYDKNGNVVSMARLGFLGSQYTPVNID